MTIEGCVMNYYTFAVVTAFVTFVFLAPAQIWAFAGCWLIVAFLLAFLVAALWSTKTTTSTSYYWRLWRFTLSICHLPGTYWRWKPWKRFSFHYWNPKK